MSKHLACTPCHIRMTLMVDHRITISKLGGSSKKAVLTSLRPRFRVVAAYTGLASTTVDGDCEITGAATVCATLSYSSRARPLERKCYWRQSCCWPRGFPVARPARTRCLRPDSCRALGTIMKRLRWQVPVAFPDGACSYGCRGLRLRLHR